MGTFYEAGARRTPGDQKEILVTLVAGPGPADRRLYFRTQSDNQSEVLALRHQIGVAQRKTPKPKLEQADRRLWVWLSRSWSRWRSALVIVKPDTVIDWHRRGFRWYWTWKVGHGNAGRPSIPKETRELIRILSRNNPTWGAPRIHSELLKLYPDLESFRRQIHGPTSEATVTDLADILNESLGTVGVRRFFHGADGAVSSVVRLCFIVS